MSHTLSSVVYISHKTIGKMPLWHFHRCSASMMCKRDCKEKWCSHASYTHCFGQTIIPIKLITVSSLSHNVLAKSLPPLNKTQCLWMQGHNLSLGPKWDCIILCNLLSCVLPVWVITDLDCIFFLQRNFIFKGTMMLPFNFIRKENLFCF